MAGVPYFSNLRAGHFHTNRHTKKTASKPLGSGCFSIGLPCFYSGPSACTPKESKSGSQGDPKTSKPAEGLLSEATTDRVIEKSFEEANKSKFIDFASSQTAQSLAQLTQNKAAALNPFTQTAKRPPAKKRRKDLFD